MTVDFSPVDRPAVLEAIAEYDDLGAEAFLDTYGFTPTRTDLLVHDEKTYESKAILGVALRHATGVTATSEEVSDGAVEVLEALGFEIRPPVARTADEVGTEAARNAWAEAARPVLLEAAGRYRATVTLKTLATAVQESAGITTTQAMHLWIGDVLGRVTDDCESRGEPLLSSLCVSAQGSAGEAYADAVENARGDRPADPDDHAAHERLACYRHWDATGLPSDGGTPLRTAHFKTVRKSTPRQPAARATTSRPATPRKKPASRASTAPEAPAPKPLRLCPRCFTQVPATGLCDYCD